MEHRIDLLFVFQVCLLFACVEAAILSILYILKRPRWMKRLALMLFVFSATAAWAANTQLSSLSAVSSVAGTDLFYDVQTAGSGGLKATAAQIAAYNNSLFSRDCTATSLGVLTCLKTNNVSFTSAATTAIGTSGATIGLLNANNTYSGTDTFSGNNTYSGVSTFTGALVVPMRTVTASGAVTVSATTDYFICINKGTPAATTVNLPATPATGLTYLIKDCGGVAATDNITITPNSGTIDGASTYVMSTNYQSAAVTYNGASWSVN